MERRIAAHMIEVKLMVKFLVSERDMMSQGHLDPDVSSNRLLSVSWRGRGLLFHIYYDSRAQIPDATRDRGRVVALPNSIMSVGLRIGNVTTVLLSCDCERALD